MSETRKQKILLSDNRIGWLLLRLSLPAFLGMFATTLYGVVNTIFIGHNVGSSAIAGIVIVFPVQMLSMGVGMMTGTGGASLISRLIGEGDKEGAERTLGNAIFCTLTFCFLITAVGLLNVDFWLKLMGASEAILPYARDYMGLILYGVYFQTCTVAVCSLIAAEGNARVPMIGTAVGAVLNIIFCWVFVVLLNIGVKGSAIAVVIGQMVSFCILFTYYFKGHSYLKIHSRNLRPCSKIIHDILSIGIASLAQNLSGGLSAVFVNRALIAHGGDSFVSAFGIINQIMNFSLLPCMAISQGLQPIVGFNYGAKYYGKTIKAIKIATVASVTYAACVFVVLYSSPEIFIKIFTSDADLVALGSYASKRIFLAVYLIGFMPVSFTVFQAIGKAVQSFIISIARPLLFLIPLIFLLPSYWRLEGIWLAFPITDVLTFVLVLTFFIHQFNAFKREEDRRVFDSKRNMLHS